MNRTQLHSMENIIFISMAAILCGCDTWNEIELFGKAKRDWLENYLDLPNGIPSHDTFNRFFSLLDPDKFEACFRKWVTEIATEIDQDIISVDGKTIRGSRTFEKSPIHVVSAWSNANKVSLGQLKTFDKSNEITIIPELLEAMFIEGSTITIDAMGCHTAIAEKIVSKNANYVLAVKGNQNTLFQDIIDAFSIQRPIDTHQTLDSDHGRVETRNYAVISDLSSIRNAVIWPKLKTIVRVESERFIKTTGKTEVSVRYYISSLPANARLNSHAVRSHWGVENELHWMLDVAFNEDKSTKRNRNAVQNFSLANKIALSILQKDQTHSVGVKSKRKLAGMDNDYLGHLMRLG